MRCAVEAGCLMWLEFPADFRACGCGAFASIWQLGAFRNLERLRIWRGAICQCEWPNANLKKPRGFFSPTSP
eukprot:4370562-Lingulodinium_polyedra.AAC.1